MSVASNENINVGNFIIADNVPEQLQNARIYYSPELRQFAAVDDNGVTKTFFGFDKYNQFVQYDLIVFNGNTKEYIEELAQEYVASGGDSGYPSDIGAAYGPEYDNYQQPYADEYQQPYQDGYQQDPYYVPYPGQAQTDYQNQQPYYDEYQQQGGYDDYYQQYPPQYPPQDNYYNQTAYLPQPGYSQPGYPPMPQDYYQQPPDYYSAEYQDNYSQYSNDYSSYDRQSPLSSGSADEPVKKKVKDPTRRLFGFFVTILLITIVVIIVRVFALPIFSGMQGLLQ